MSAIAAVHVRSGRPDRAALNRMLAATPHRGDTQLVVAVGRTLLGCVVDRNFPRACLASAWDVAVALAGSLDNARELGDELTSRGLPQAREARSDAETVLHAFRAWGTDAVRHLRGSFAGAVSDGGRLWCFRDQVGQRPLFVRVEGETAYAASEIKQVVAGSGIPREPDLDHLAGVLFGGVVTSTAVRGVARVPRGTIGAVDLGRVPSYRRYWDPSQYVETSRLSLDEAKEGLVEALDRAVRRSLRGRDAVLLSGGLDSPTLAAFAARVDGPEPVRAVTAVYPDHPSVDESSWTQMIAGHFGMPLHPFVATASSLDDVEEWVDRIDGPVDRLTLPEAAEAYSVSRNAGARTVLSGEIAEHLFECRAFLIDHLLSHGRLRAAFRDLHARHAQGRRLRKAVRDVAGTFAPPPMLMAYRRHVVERRGFRGVPPWVNPERMASSDDGERPIFALGPRSRWRRAQTSPFKGPAIGFEADEICAAWCGVEVRRPFADVDLWQFVLSLPAEVKFCGIRPKSILREAMRSRLPDAVIDREDKTYFDDYHLSKPGYDVLRRIVVGSDHRLPGIDYALLGARIEGAEMAVTELQWARDLARVHAFLDRCGADRLVAARS